jgi:cullin-4
MSKEILLKILKKTHSIIYAVKISEKELKYHAFCFQKRGKTIVIPDDTDNDRSMVQELLEFKDQMDNVVEKCFRSNPKFQTSLKDAFEYFINQRQNKPAEYIGKPRFLCPLYFLIEPRII